MDVNTGNPHLLTQPADAIVEQTIHVDFWQFKILSQVTPIVACDQRIGCCRDV